MTSKTGPLKEQALRTMIEAHHDLGSLQQYGEEDPIMIRDVAQGILRETFPNENIIQFPSLEVENRLIPSFALNTPEYRVRYLFLGIKEMFLDLQSSGESLASMMQRVNSLSSRDKEGILLSAAKHGDLEVVRVLVDSGISEEDRGWGLLNAARNGHLEIVRILLNSKTSQQHRGWALQFAAKNGKLETVRALLASGISEHHRGWAVMDAIENGHLEIVRVLLASGISEKDREWSLWHAAKKRDLEIVRALLASGISEERQVAVVSFILAIIVAAITYYIQSYLTSGRP